MCSRVRVSHEDMFSEIILKDQLKDWNEELGVRKKKKSDHVWKGKNSKISICGSALPSRVFKENKC